ncbi:transmembrane protein 69 [Erpetoichthys calabaricus]|uniref:transmembrane protein 69 n=1 Tax=Erpetoichthys calabaricus TaxID=27687 RepID=UPI002234B290|nr:transmembrane protein 69 [Erpetoichthys calabaricus]
MFWGVVRSRFWSSYKVPLSQLLALRTCRTKASLPSPAYNFSHHVHSLVGRPDNPGSCWPKVQSLHTSCHHHRKKRSDVEPGPRELDLLRYDMKEVKRTPKPALYLGILGLVPFVSAPLLMAVMEVYYPEVAYAQVAYGACILSFLGGARWGFTVPEGSPAPPDWLNLANSVVPPLVAWVALLLRGSITEAALMVIMGLGIALHYDISLLPGYPAWFKALRAILTVVATFCLVATLILKNIYPEKRLSLDDGQQSSDGSKEKCQ